MSSNTPDVVCVFGGGGVAPRIAGELCEDSSLHVASVAPGSDSGGDSGVLRDKHGVLPPGDARRYIIAQSKDDSQKLLRELFGFRYPPNDALYPGTVVGNFLADACERRWGRIEGVRNFSRLLNIRGSVHYASKQDTHLMARLNDGTILRGEAAIDTRDPFDMRHIVDAWLEPEVDINTDVLKYLERAKLIVLSPGDLYTSTIAILRVRLLTHAINRASGKVVWVASLMTKPAETRDYDVADFVDTFYEYGLERVDAVLVHTASISRRLLARYKEDHSTRVLLSKSARARLHARGVQIVEGDFLDRSEAYGKHGLIRHDPKKVVPALLQLVA